jgi:hypothetical protein
MIFLSLLPKINKADILSQAVFLRFVHLITVCNQQENHVKELTFYEFNHINCYYNHKMLLV